ncbi:MAG: bifunctional folylpolyglutamate synthase/ dihydrofolate synthase [Planctomycetaceae bacterium]|nr:bifunctional folylpolyglutamate synthase/ dihydrofolate synthase [Planctomycetaceae bacterium]
MGDSNDLRGASYQTALDYLYGRVNYERASGGPPRGRDLNLERMRELLARVDNPQQQFPAVHIAGTKGKGSTAAMVAGVLKAAGYRTGLYTSPHLDYLEERIQIDGQRCSPDELMALVDVLRPTVVSMDEEAERGGPLGTPTFFEITTAMTMLHFASQTVDVAVLEVGLGGRLDSTNVCRPVVTAITSISFDHVRQLGDTLAEIAAEKAGIIKPGAPIVCGVTGKEPRKVIRSIAAERGAPTCFVGEDYDFQHHQPNGLTLLPAALHYTSELGGAWRLPDVQLGMIGAHQAANAAVAIATLQQLELAGWRIPKDAIYRGLAESRCPARIEIVSRRPTVVLDAAHNVASIDALLAAVEAGLCASQRILIFAAARDKDVPGMLKRLLESFDSIILTQYLDNPRAVAPADAKEMLERGAYDADLSRKPAITTCETPALAWQHCETIVTPDALVCITGSFFLAAEMRNLVTEASPLSATSM